MNIYKSYYYLLTALMIYFSSAVFAHGNKEHLVPEFCKNLKDSVPHCGKTPSSAFDKNKILWIVYVDGKYIKLVSSDDEGESFSSAVTVNPKPEVISSDGENRPKVAIGNNNEIYISWTEKTEGRYTGDVRFSRSLDGGKTFSKPITINDDGLLTSHRYDSLSVMDNGDVYLTWLDKRDLVAAKRAKKPYNGSAVYYTVSKDSGKSFEKNKKITDHSCECCRVITEQDSQGNAVVLWRHVFGDNIRDHAIMTLNGHSDIQRVTFDDWQINACPHHGPDMVLDSEDNLHQVWFTGKEGKGGLHYAKFDVETKSLKNEYHIDPSPMASRPQIAQFDNELFIIWKRVEGDKTLLNMMRSVENSNEWSEISIIAETTGASDHPQLVQNDEHLLATWWTQEKGMQIVKIGDAIDSSLQPFTTKSFETIKNAYQGQNVLMVLWSLDCPPCFKEMALLKENITSNNFPKLVLISTNGKQDLSELNQVLKRYSLHTADNWYFDGLDEQLRYVIDPTWYGELPRSYYIKQDGAVLTHRGLLKQANLDDWLNNTN